MTYFHQLCKNTVIMHRLPEGSVPAQLFAPYDVVNALEKMPPEARLKALEPIIDAAHMVEKIATRAGIDTPALCVYGPAAKQIYASAHVSQPYISNQGFSHVIGLNLHLICDGSALLPNEIPLRQVLRLTPEELYAVLAHETGHIRHRHTPHPEHTDTKQNLLAQHRNHRNEYEADREVIRLGGDADALIRGILKIIRIERETIYQATYTINTTTSLLAQCFPSAAEKITADKVHLWESHMQLRHNQARHLTEPSHTHPAVRDRLERVRTQESLKSWQERLTTSMQGKVERGL